jgi:hypothetical protein
MVFIVHAQEAGGTLMRVLRVFLWLLLFTGSSATADPVSIVTYNSRADWQAAATGRVTSFGFEVDNWNQPFDTSGSLGPAWGAPGFAHMAACCPMFGYVMFQAEGTGADMNIADTTWMPGYTAWTTGNVLSATGESQTITLYRDPVTAVAFDWQQLWGTEPLAVLLSTGTSYLLSGTPQQPEFFGVRSSVPIEWVRITHASAVLNIDNVTTDTVIPTPEPVSILLFGTGLTALLGSRRKRR